MPITFILQDEHQFKHTPTENYFQIWINAVEHVIALAEDEHLEVTIRIINKQESTELNETFRQKQGPTNILSFPYDPIPGIEEDLLGDLAICAPIVAEEAEQQCKPIIAHWAHLTIHGMLHLFGFDHIQNDEAEKMEQLEIKILQGLGFANPYAETTK